MIYSETNFTEISDKEKQAMADARGFYGEYPMIDRDTPGERYMNMEYKGSEANDSSEPGWQTVTDYFTDSEGRNWWRQRSFFVDPYGEIQFRPNSQKHFGHYSMEWEKTR